MSVRVDVLADHVAVSLDGWDRRWSLRSSVLLPYSIITSARVALLDEVRPDLGWRTAGAYWPGVIATGHYKMRHDANATQFWCVYRDRELLVIDTRVDWPARVVLQTPDRHDLAWLISERLPHAA